MLHARFESISLLWELAISRTVKGVGCGRTSLSRLTSLANSAFSPGQAHVEQLWIQRSSDVKKALGFHCSVSVLLIDAKPPFKQVVSPARLSFPIVPQMELNKSRSIPMCCCDTPVTVAPSQGSVKTAFPYRSSGTWLQMSFAFSQQVWSTLEMENTPSSALL